MTYELWIPKRCMTRRILDDTSTKSPSLVMTCTEATLLDSERDQT